SFTLPRVSSCLPTSSQSAFFQAGLLRTISSGVSTLNLTSWATCSQPARSMYLCLRYGAWWRQRSIMEISRKVGCVVGTIFNECDRYQSLSHFPGELYASALGSQSRCLALKSPNAVSGIPISSNQAVYVALVCVGRKYAPASTL